MAELIFFSAGLASSVTLNLFLLPFFLSCAALFLLLSKKTGRRSRKALLLAFAFSAGLLAGNLRLPEMQDSPLFREVSAGNGTAAFWIDGKVLSSEPGAGGSKAVVETGGFASGDRRISDRSRVQLYLPFGPPPPGSRFTASAVLFLPKEATNPGQFDYRESLRGKGISVCGKVKDGSLFKTVEESRFPFPGRYREMIRRQISEWGGDESGVILALLLGERGLIDPSSEARMVRSGLYHLVALSGFNIGMILLLISFFFVVLKLAPSSADVFALVFLPAYGLLVGPQPSLWRAIIMGMIFLGARLLARPHAALRALLLSFALLLLADPREILDVGFQLTFSAALGIILMYGRCPRIFKPGTVSDYALKLFWVGFSAQLFTLPLLALYFQRVSPAGFIWTPFASLPMFPLFAFGMLYLFGGCFIPGVDIFLVSLVRFFTKLFLLVPELSSDVSLSSLFVPRPALFYLAAFALSLAVFVFGGKRKMAGAVLIVPVMIAAYFFPHPFEAKPKDSMIVLDVGQGSSQLLLYDDRVYLVDAADTSYQSISTARTVIEPLLARLHLGRIDGVFITHWDRDHAGSLPELACDIPIGFVGYPAAAPPPDEIATMLKRKKAWMIPLSAGNELSLGRAQATVLHPPGDSRLGSDNDLSLVMRFRIGGINMLFTGDVENEGLEELAGNPSPFRADILLAPHHGARKSLNPRFAREISPRFTVFTVGKNNRFNHPHAPVVDLYKKLGSRTFRTDSDGAVLFKMDGDRIIPFTFASSDWTEELWR